MRRIKFKLTSTNVTGTVLLAAVASLNSYTTDKPVTSDSEDKGTVASEIQL
jgi:hypothetical protein